MKRLYHWMNTGCRETAAKRLPCMTAQGSARAKLCPARQAARAITRNGSYGIARGAAKSRGYAHAFESPWPKVVWRRSADGPSANPCAPTWRFAGKATARLRNISRTGLARRRDIRHQTEPYGPIRSMTAGRRWGSGGQGAGRTPRSSAMGATPVNSDSADVAAGGVATVSALHTNPLYAWVVASRSCLARERAVALAASIVVRAVTGSPKRRAEAEAATKRPAPTTAGQQRGSEAADRQCDNSRAGPVRVEKRGADDGAI